MTKKTSRCCKLKEEMLDLLLWRTQERLWTSREVDYVMMIMMMIMIMMMNEARKKERKDGALNRY
jgi:hypothetical protein